MAANVTFDGPNKLIICNAGTTELDVKDTYSYWKEWMMLSDNAKYLEAMSVVGGDPTVGALSLGSTFFLENGWKIRPQEAAHILAVTGNLYARTGAPFVATLGAFNVQVQQIVSNLVDTVATGGSEAPTAAQIRAEMDSNSIKLTSILAGISLDQIIDGTDSIKDLFRYILAFFTGEVSGAGTEEIIFKSPNGTKNRITMTVDTSGNRSIVVKDGEDE